MICTWLHLLIQSFHGLLSRETERVLLFSEIWWIYVLMNTWGSARRWSPAYTASRTDRHTQCSSCGYSCRRWSSWCRHRSEGTLWSPLHLQQQSQCVRGDHTFCNICSAQRSKITWEIKKKKKKGGIPAQRNKTKEGVTSSGFFIEDVQRGGIGAAWRVAGSLPPGLVTRLVGVPQLPTVVAELRVTSLPAAAQLGTLRTAISYHRVAEER